MKNKGEQIERLLNQKEISENLKASLEHKKEILSKDKTVKK